MNLPRPRFKIRAIAMILAVLAIAVPAAYHVILALRHRGPDHSVGLDPPSAPRAEVRSVRLDPEAAIVAYFRRHGIELEKDERMSFWWTVARPSAGDFRVAVAFHSFPPTSTEQQMRNELLPISLAFILNAPAHLAMSYPSQRGMRPDAALLSPDDELTKKRMLELFELYKSIE